MYATHWFFKNCTYTPHTGYLQIAHVRQILFFFTNGICTPHTGYLQIAHIRHTLVIYKLHMYATHWLFTNCTCTPHTGNLQITHIRHTLFSVYVANINCQTIGNFGGRIVCYIPLVIHTAPPPPRTPLENFTDDAIA